MPAHRAIASQALVAAPPEAVYDFLCDLRNHWALADRFVDVLCLNCGQADNPDRPPDGGQVRLRGPLGISRMAITQVTEQNAPRGLRGVALIGQGTVAHVEWSLGPSDGKTWVSLEASVESAGPLDRLLLALGGRRWLRRRFAEILERLGGVVGA